MIKSMALAVALVALAIPATSQASSSAPPGVYTVEPKPTRVLFAVSRFGCAPYRGEFHRFLGTLLLGESEVGARRLEVSTPISGLMTSSGHLGVLLAGPG